MSRGRKEEVIFIDDNPHLEPKDEFIEKNKKLVYSTLRKYFGTQYRIDNQSYNWQDLEQIGFIGLLKAYHNYNPEFGTKFSTYAVPMIAGEVQRFSRDHGTIVKFSRYMKQSYHRINKIIKEEALNVSVKEYVLERNDRELFEDARIGFPSYNMIKEFRNYVNSNARTNPASFDTPVFTGDGDAEITLGETTAFSFHDDPTEIMIREFRATCLTEQENLIYTYLVDKEKTQAETGKEVGLSQVHVSRVFKKIGMKYLRYRKEAGLLYTADIPEKYAKAFEEKEASIRAREAQAEKIRKEKEEKERQKMKEKELRNEAKRLLKKGHSQAKVQEMTGLSRAVVTTLAQGLRKSGDLPTSKTKKATSKSVKHVKAGKPKPVGKSIPKEVSSISKIIKDAESTIKPLAPKIETKDDKYEDKLDNSITPIKTPKPSPASAEKKMNVESNGLKDEPFLRPDTPEPPKEEEKRCYCYDEPNMAVENPDAWKPDPSEAVVTLKVEGSAISLQQLQYELGKALESAFASGKEKVSNYKLQLKLQ